jgi:hypothetical protein
MRRGWTVLVVVVVAAVALAAGFDALRGDADPQPAAKTGAEQPTSSTDRSPTSPPEEQPSAGVLYYTDGSCRLQAIEVPGARPADAPNWDECRFVLSPDRRRVAGAGSGWDPHSDPLRGRLYQSQDGTIQVSTNAGPEEEPFAGTAPAWRPDGTLTYFADGAVREWPEGAVVLSQRDLLRAMRRSPFPALQTRFHRFRMREAAWLTDRRLAAILTAEGETGNEDMLAIYDGAELDVFTFDAPGGLSELRASPGGRYVAAKSTGGRDAPGGFVMLESGRGELNSPGIVGYRAIAWSPDEQWVAVAAEGGVFVYRPRVPGPPDVELDLDAHDLDWRGEGVPLVGVDEVQRWLGDVGLMGRLFVTETEGDGCALRVLQIPDLGWAERPPSGASPCRFHLDDGGVPLPEAVVPQPGGDERASCEGVPDCAIAWRPDGRLTAVVGGELFAGRPGRRNELLLGVDGLRRIFGRPSALEEVAWLDDRRFWAVVRSGESSSIALLTTDGLVFEPSFTARMIEGLRVSATGMVAARTDQSVVFFDSGGRRAMTFPNGQAVAWAPGELVAAVATPSEILFVAPVSREVLSLPLQVRDLEWVVP